ncbi:hypothetical protein C7212DRAFT_364465 [Tuber magnatum]|uniref:TPR-like protein n=1 Tax=Tuber magnatum TaxID=42249 RepID=A0A317SMV4_9PEZI|nr:hypothetical protein C7212DRAFT_364465 [Tuber magnatum]
MAERIFRNLLEGVDGSLSPANPDVLDLVSHTATALAGQRNNLAQVLQDQGKYDESEKMNRRELEGRETILGPDHPDTLASANNLALVLRDQGKYDESEAMHRCELNGCEKILGTYHPSTLTSVDNLAQVLQDQGKYDESKMNRRALEGPYGRAMVTSTGMLLRRDGNYDEPEAISRRVQEGNEQALD